MHEAAFGPESRCAIIRIGPVCLAIDERAGIRWRLETAYEPFLVTGASPDLRVTAEQGPPGAPPGPPTFRLDHLASIHRAGASWIFRLGEEDAAATAVDRVMTLDGGGSATIRLDTQKFPAHLHGYPLAYPLEDLLFRHLLADRRAVLVHACGVAWEGRGFLFVGASGAGKSTMARLWSAAGATILNDDRIVLEAAGDRVLIHPTPWSGDMPEVGGGPTPLAGLYFLRQGTPIRFEPVRPATAVGLLYAKSFPPLWDRERTGKTLETLEAACRHAPCGWLMVPPDSRAVAWVQGRP